MKIDMLGPMEVRVNGEEVTPTANKPRQVIALLAIRAGRVVPVPSLVDELWGGRKEPRSAVPTIQTYVLGLRRRINAALSGDTAKDVLGTRPGGYILNISPEDVDVSRYHRLAAAGERALAAGDHESAANLLSAALASWRGPALVDVPTGTRIAAELSRLEQSRLAVLESRIEADLRLGRHHQILGELAELTARYPMHEKLCAHYMTALTASGQKWRALEAFWALRNTLIVELGIEPSIPVQRLQRAILGSDAPDPDTAGWQLAAWA